jgi:hypothetical protein
MFLVAVVVGDDAAPLAFLWAWGVLGLRRRCRSTAPTRKATARVEVVKLAAAQRALPARANATAQRLHARGASARLTAAKAAAALATSAAAGALSDAGGLVLSDVVVPHAGANGRIKVGHRHMLQYGAQYGARF